MPKRRMTPARKAAIAKWQRAGANSRKAKATGKPVGKSGLITLYHRTTKANANKIAKSQKMISKNPSGRVFFTTERIFKAYGPGMVSVRVLKSKARSEERMPWDKHHFYHAYSIDPKALVGSKIRREL